MTTSPHTGGEVLVPGRLDRFPKGQGTTILLHKSTNLAGIAMDRKGMDLGTVEPAFSDGDAA